MKYYTIYLAKTDEIVAFGSAQQCAKQLGTSLNCVRSLVCRVRQGKTKKYDEIYVEVSND